MLVTAGSTHQPVSTQHVQFPGSSHSGCLPTDAGISSTADRRSMPSLTIYQTRSMVNEGGGVGGRGGCCIRVWQACQALLCRGAAVPSEQEGDAKPTSDPVGRPWYISGFAAMPAKGKPLAMPLAKSMMSGTTPLKCWCAHHLPVLATPDCTCHQKNDVKRQHHAH